MKVKARGTFANENEEYQCQNCQETWELSELNPMPTAHIFERVAPGEPMPAGECPECGAVCHARR